MSDPDDVLAVALNPLHDEISRLAAWRMYEIKMWTQAVLKRGVHLDLVPPEYFRSVRDAIRDLERDQPKTLTALNP